MTRRGGTPGPWFIESHGIMDATRSRTICMFGESDQDDADALLVAAAPELLRLLTALVEADADAEVVPDVYAAHVRSRWEEARDEARHLLSQFGRQLQAGES